MTKWRFRNSFVTLVVKGNFWRRSRRFFFLRGQKWSKIFFSKNVMQPIKWISGMC